MIHLEPLRSADWSTALHFALARVPFEQRPARVSHCLHLLETGVLDPRGIWVARAADTIVGVQVCVPLAGSTCLFWLPTAEPKYVDQLLQACLDWCRSIKCKLVQALVSTDELSLAQPLLTHGFQRVTQMHQLQHDLAGVPDTVLMPLRLASYRPSLMSSFATTLGRTYEGTLDCPELNGKRTIEEILAGHRGQGKFHPDCWWLALDGEAPVGVLMLNELPDAVTWELTYLGVVPEYRGRGFGRAMSLHALQVLRDRLATRMLLAVDGRNLSARRLYQSLGFFEVECNEVLLRFF